MANDNKQPEIWTYCGVRLGKGNKRLHAWHDGTGAELIYFAKLTGHAIGGQYEVVADRAEDGTFRTVSPSTLQYAGSKHENADLVAGWQAEHRLAEISLARDRAERKAKAEPDSFELALAPLRDLRARSCRSYADRTAFLAMVIEGLGR